MAVADTSFLIDLMREDPQAVAKLESYTERSVSLWIPAPALHELYYGARRHPEHEREIARIETLEHAVPALPLGPQDARRAGILEAELEADGVPLGIEDVRIAAIALGRGQPVVTRDGGYDRIEGLQVDAY